MLFNSLEFLIFLPLVLIGLYVTPYRFAWFLLLAASLYFYSAWKPDYLPLLLLCIGTNYIAARKISTTKTLIRRKVYLAVSLVVSLGVLFCFKYVSFLLSSLNSLSLSLGADRAPLPKWDIVFPIGISFYTFQALGYTIDVYRNRIIAENHPGYFALFIAYFPQILAGPIGRAGQLLPQLKQKITFDPQLFTSGLKLIAWGFFKKMVIADNVGLFVDQVYANPMNYSGFSLLFASYLFAFQIYCDFSGYSDIAIGTARLMGIRLMDNFRQPYFSTNVREFWQRWHISLTSWFRDYVYIPMGGNQSTSARWLFSIIAVFALSGLWHGANWTFLAWGLYHGALYLLHVTTGPLRSRVYDRFGVNNYPMLHRAIQMFITFHLVVIGWVFFRAQSLEHAWYIMGHMFSGLSWDSITYLLNHPSAFQSLTGFHIFARAMPGSRGLAQLTVYCSQYPAIVYGMLAVIVLLVRESFQSSESLREACTGLRMPVRWAGYYVLVAAILIFGAWGGQQFIYFQF